MKAEVSNACANPYEMARVMRHYLETHPWVSAYDEAGRWIWRSLQSIMTDPLRFLEIGSGGGELALSLSQAFGSQEFEMCLVEPSRLMRRAPAHRELESDPRVVVCKHPFFTKDCANEAGTTFDCIIAVLSLHHVRDWQPAAEFLVRKPGPLAFVLGEATGDAALVSTGYGGFSVDYIAERFWSEYHRFLNIYGFVGNERPNQLTPLDYAPTKSLLRQHGLAKRTSRLFEVKKPLSYRTLLDWIEHGALTSLLAMGDKTDRLVMAKHMQEWLRDQGVDVETEWIFRGGVQFELMFRPGAT